MPVYVDDLRVYPNAWGPFLAGSCHMWADTEEELHGMAQQIGLQRSWFQTDGKVRHYDLTAFKRALAIRKGALEKRHPNDNTLP